MNTLWTMFQIEWLKARRSRVPLFILGGFLWIPLGITFIMLVYKDPEAARNMGLLAAKAELAGGSADWPSYFSMIKQGVALGGYILFCILMSWVFGREFTDGTLKDMLAVPVPRSAVLLAKFAVSAVWILAIVLVSLVICLALGLWLDLPLGSTEVLLEGSLTLFVTALLVLAVAFPTALFASMGRGYLLAIGVAIMTLLLANVVAVAGWGTVLPWSIPVIYAEGGTQAGELSAVSYAVVLLTGLVGVVGTIVWWRTADQNR